MDLLPLSLAYFLEVARRGSVTDAAHALVVAPSAVSRQIAKLEMGLGVQLFARHPRGMDLTAAGSRLLAHVRRSEAQTAVLVKELRADREGDPRHVTVACSEGFARRIVPRAMAEYRLDNPDVSFQLDVVPREEATRRVADGVADVAVNYVLGAQEDVRVECSVVIPVVAIVPAGHELAGRSGVGLAELATYPLALASVKTTQRELFDLGARLESLSIRPALVCDELAPLYEFVRGGGGVALVGDLGDLEFDASAEGVQHVPLDHPVFQQREAQVQTMLGRRLPWSTFEFAGLLVAQLRRP